MRSTDYIRCRLRETSSSRRANAAGSLDECLLRFIFRQLSVDLLFCLSAICPSVENAKRPEACSAVPCARPQRLMSPGCLRLEERRNSVLVFAARRSCTDAVSLGSLAAFLFVICIVNTLRVNQNKAIIIVSRHRFVSSFIQFACFDDIFETFP